MLLSFSLTIQLAYTMKQYLVLALATTKGCGPYVEEPTMFHDDCCENAV